MIFKRSSFPLFTILFLLFFSMTFNTVMYDHVDKGKTEITSFENNDVESAFRQCEFSRTAFQKYESSRITQKTQLAGFVIPTLRYTSYQPEVVQEVQPVDILKDSFLSLAGLAAAILFFTSLLKRSLNSNNTFTIVISGIVGLILSGVGWYFGLGIFVGVEWFYIMIYGLAATLIANGASTWGITKAVLEFFKLKVPSN